VVSTPPWHHLRNRLRPRQNLGSGVRTLRLWEHEQGGEVAMHTFRHMDVCIVILTQVQLRKPRDYMSVADQSSRRHVGSCMGLGLVVTRDVTA
jgi:hypothetical protein